MDIYRFFHPHHNPRLHRSALRQQEISELEHAAAELTKALERAQKRAEFAPSPPIMPQHFEDIIKATKFTKRSLQTLCDAHQGDSPEQFAKLMRERAGCAGWESWARLVHEQLDKDGYTTSLEEQDPPNEKISATPKLQKAS